MHNFYMSHFKISISFLLCPWKESFSIVIPFCKYFNIVWGDSIIRTLHSSVNSSGEDFELCQCFYMRYTETLINRGKLKKKKKKNKWGRPQNWHNSVRFYIEHKTSKTTVSWCNRWLFNSCDGHNFDEK